MAVVNEWNQVPTRLRSCWHDESGHLARVKLLAEKHRRQQSYHHQAYRGSGRGIIPGRLLNQLGSLAQMWSGVGPTLRQIIIDRLRRITGVGIGGTPTFGQRFAQARNLLAQ